MRLVHLALALVLASAGCRDRPDDTTPGADASTDAGTDACTRPASRAFAPLSTRCEHFVDAQGRVVFLHGINTRVAGVFDVSFDDGRQPLEPIPELTADDTHRMRAMGFDLLRLPVNWSGVEPTETGGFDEGYLDRVAHAVELARAAGLYVLVDLHQDAYSKEIGEDGAPRWAISPPPTTLLGGPLTDLGARRSSGQVLAAFGTFFDPSSTEGQRLRDRFARMAAHLAARFRGDPTVVGYELYNEPIASDAALHAFHLAVARAVRDADPGHLVFFEPPVLPRGLLDRAALASAPFELDGAVYAPHVYTLAFYGTDAQRRAFTLDTLRLSNENVVREAASWGTPALVTEFGYDPNGIRADEYLADQVTLQDELGLSAAFWVWKERSQGSWGLFDYDPTTNTWTERDHVRRALARVTPVALAGWPAGPAHYDRAARSFEVSYVGSAEVTAPTVLYVPAPGDFAADFTVQCDGVTLAGVQRDAATGEVAVGCAGPGMHVVTLAAR